jgi:hypothetical protein
MWHFTAEERCTSCWIVALSGYITYGERWGCWLSTSCGRRGGRCSYWSETNGRITPGVDFTSLQFILPLPLPNPPHSFVSDISAIVYVLCYCHFVFCIVYTFHVSCIVVQAVFAYYKQNCFIYYVPSPNNSFTFCSEYGGTIYPRNAGNIVSDRMVVKTGRSQTEYLLSRKPEIFQNFYRPFVTLVYGNRLNFIFTNF